MYQIGIGGAVAGVKQSLLAVGGFVDEAVNEALSLKLLLLPTKCLSFFRGERKSDDFSSSPSVLDVMTHTTSS